MQQTYRRLQRILNTVRPSLRGAKYATAAALIALAACSGHDDVAMARGFIEKGDYASAEVALKSAIQANPKSAELRVMLADALEQRHELAEAEEQLRKAIDAGGDANALTPRIAQLMLDRSDVQGLIRGYKDKRLGNATADSNLRGLVALAYLSQNLNAEAQQQLKNVDDVHSVRLARAQMLVAAGKPQEAMTLLQASDPNNPTPWWVLRAAKRIALANGEPDKSLQFMKRAYDAAPWNLGVVGEYGEALISAGQFDEASKVRDRLKKDGPAFFWTFYLDAVLQNHAGHAEDSLAAATTALKLSPEHLGATLIAASLELRKGDVLQANARMRPLVRDNSNSVALARLLAQSEVRLGYTQDAANTIKRGLALVPNDPQLLMLRANLEMSARQYKEATETLSALLATRPDDPEALLALAEAKLMMADRTGIPPLLEKAASANDTAPALMGRLVATALRANNVALAKKLADQAVAKFPDDPQAQLTAAAVVSAQGDRAGAWTRTLAVLDKVPSNVNAISALASMVRTPEQRRELMTRYTKALNGRESAPQIYMDYAALLRFEGGKEVTPLAVLEKGIEAWPESVAIRAALVEQNLRTGNADNALTVAQTGAGANNAPAEAHALLAATYDRLGKVEQALEAYRKLVGQYPHRADWRLKLAQLESAGNRTQEATTLLRALIKDRPFDVTGYVALATLMSKNNLTEALSVANQLGERDEFKGASMLLVGDVLQAAGKNAEALEQFSKAVKAGIVPAANIRTAKLLEHMGNTSAADSEMTIALQRFPNDASVRVAAAQQALGRGNANAAVEHFQKLVAQSPDDPVLLNDLAWAQVLAGRPEALGNARKAIAAMPNNANVLHTYGLALAKAGKQNEAIEALRASANMAPLAAMPRLHLAENLVAAGNREEAQKSIRGIDANGLDDKYRADLAKLKTALGITQ